MIAVGLGMVSVEIFMAGPASVVPITVIEYRLYRTEISVLLDKIFMNPNSIFSTIATISFLIARTLWSFRARWTCGKELMTRGILVVNECFLVS